jgi:ATP-dependent Clp protease ATP-binding subunit ClpA
VLDDGRLTDSFSRTVDFQNTIIIATSNAHSALIQSELQGGSEISAIADTLKRRLTEYFKPEFINRFSQVVVFKPLSREDIIAVARLNLTELSRTLAESQAIVLTCDDSAIEEIVVRGYDPVYGARPLKRTIQTDLLDTLATYIIDGTVGDGSKVAVSAKKGELVFSVK